MKPIVIYTYDFDMGIGGIKVMHKLCHMLNTLGYESYLMPIHPRSEFLVHYDNTPMITQKIYDMIENCIIVYPEGIKYNPLNAKMVVRWMLGPAVDDVISTYTPTDIIYWYNEFYHTPKLGHYDNKLNVTEFHSDIFFDKGYERNASCYTFRKSNPISFKHPVDSIFIPFNAAGDLYGLSELFNRTEEFYCYDTYTFLPIQAAMCGCTSIVVPDPNISKEKWISGSPLQKYGIAYGYDDVERAIETLPLLFNEINKAEIETINQIHRFVENCENIWKKREY